MASRTDALCYGHPDVLEFSTRLLSCRPQSQGTWGVTMEGSFFFPEGGGQPADQGEIGEARVLNVRNANGQVLHVIDRPLSPGTYECRIDASWRRRYQEQHTGQHLISAAFWHLARLTTVSVHLGRTDTTIDLDSSELSEETLLAVERQVNEVIRQNRPVQSQEVSAEELPSFPLRKPSTLTGRVRVVQVDGFDASACCGLHLPETGGVGLVHATRTERIRGQIRTHWVIGMDALNHIRAQRHTIRSVSRMLGVPTEEIPEAIGRLLERLEHLERQHSDLEDRHVALLAPQLMQNIRKRSGLKVLRANLGDLPETLFTRLVKIFLREQDLGFLLLRSQGDHIAWALGCGPNLSLDFPLLRQRLLDPLQARGGGHQPLWQGVLREPDRADDLFESFDNMPPGWLGRNG